MNKCFTLNLKKRKKLAQLRAVVFEKNVKKRFHKMTSLTPATLTLKEKTSNARAVSATICKFHNVLFLNNYTEFKA